LTDLVMNTLGAFVGAGVAALIRRFLHSLKRGRNDKKEIPSLRSE
jgi:glycopeptide antibiotics resistance protein